jgi:demethylmenaquinone methyltransferase / 2-methoxy-6-polyprenyl-1,4-benzoquinol methylase
VTGPRVSESREQPNRFARELFDGLPARYDVLAEVLSMGQNRRWRRLLVDAVVAGEPDLVADVATGPAGIALQIEARTGAQVAGVDLTETMLRLGSANVRRRGRGDRIHLVAGRGEQLPFADSTFDALSFSYLLRYVADPGATIGELARVVKPGGVLANLEFGVPPNPFWHSLWLFYTRALLPVAGRVAGGPEWMDVGRFLGPSISEHYRRFPTEWHEEAWRAAGVHDVHVRLMSLGGGLVMWGRKGPV